MSPPAAPSPPEASLPRAVDVLAIGAHPDDVEIGCGATLAAMVSRGVKVGVVHLTSGEAGTRGSATIRREEAGEAMRRLGASTLDILDCGDGGLRIGREEEDALIEVLRARRPSLLFVPPEVDRHPDHERAHRLAMAAAFYAGLVKRGSGESHRPARVLAYALHEPIRPQLVVDVSAHFESKLRALDAYRSQFAPRDGEAPADEPETWVSSPTFRALVEARARHYGALIGVPLGEAFTGRGPLALGVESLLGGGA